MHISSDACVYNEFFAYRTCICYFNMHIIFSFFNFKTIPTEKKKKKSLQDKRVVTIIFRLKSCECPHPYTSKSATTLGHKSPPYNS